MKLVLPSLLLGSIFLTGCAASVQKSTSDAPIRTTAESAKIITMNVTGNQQITGSGDWEQLKSEWWSAMKSAADAVGAKFSLQEGKPQPTGDAGTLVVVNVNAYRYISQGARYGLGVITGNAYIDSNVQFMDLKTGAMLGEKRYNTSSTAWQGIFSPMTSTQIRAITTEIANELKNK